LKKANARSVRSCGKGSLDLGEIGLDASGGIIGTPHAGGFVKGRNFFGEPLEQLCRQPRIAHQPVGLSFRRELLHADGILDCGLCTDRAS